MDTKDLKKDLDKVSKGKTPARTKPETDAKTTVKSEAGAEDDKKAFDTPEVKTEVKEERKVVVVDADDDSFVQESPVKKETKSNVLLKRFENICSE